MTRLCLSVVGDRSGAGFLALIAPPNTELTISDVDGTLTESENAFPRSLAAHHDKVVAANDGAAQALTDLRDRGYWIVYVTSRGQFFTEATRQWLRDNHFADGPLRLANDLVTLPGRRTVKYKTGDMKIFFDSDFRVGVGIGNRGSDQRAYSAVGVPATAIFIFDKEFPDEVNPADAVLFSNYKAERPIFRNFPRLIPQFRKGSFLTARDARARLDFHSHRR